MDPTFDAISPSDSLMEADSQLVIFFPILRLPMELLEHLSNYLQRPDLKNLRLVSRKLCDAAERALFRHIQLKRNSESFSKFRTVSQVPRLSRKVKKVTYSGKMFAEGELRMNFDEWRANMMTQQMWTRLETDFSHMAIAKRLEGWRKDLSPTQITYHYSKFQEHVLNQKHFEAHDDERELLISTFRKLPSLREVVFDSGYDPRDYSGRIKLSRIGQEALIEPHYGGGYKYHMEQIHALMTAASVTRRPIEAISILAFSWELVPRLSGNWREMVRILGRCKRLCLQIVHVWGWDDHVPDVVAEIVSHAPQLNALELSFDNVPIRSEPDEFAKLSQIFTLRVHWPHLNIIRLRAIRTTESNLRAFLALHASTMRELELHAILLEDADPVWGVRRGSWISTIIFLQKWLKLVKIRLGGILSTDWDETWIVEDQECRDSERQRFLKYRIERFITHGGAMPLSMNCIEDSLGHRIFRDVPGDRSWRFYHDDV